MKKIVFLVFTFAFFAGASLYSEELTYNETGHFPEKEGFDAEWKAKLRTRALIKLDKMLSWALPQQERSYALEKEQEGIYFVNEVESLLYFARHFSYFSKKNPIISRVTSDKEDITITDSLLSALYESCDDEEYLEMATGEILTKVLAYRQMDEGDFISIPVVVENQGVQLVEFVVNDIFTLGLGIPAFGLVPRVRSDVAPILLFRGTDLSLESKQGWASVLSDLDVTGPGLRAFQTSRNNLSHWLQAKAKEGPKAKVMGFSLGGVLAIYTMIYEHAWINHKGSCAFNPPGVSNSVYKDWQKIPLEKKSDFTIYVTKGDFIPKIGKMVGTVYELSLDYSLRPIAAHVKLMSCQRHFYYFAVDRNIENKSRS